MQLNEEKKHTHTPKFGIKLQEKLEGKDSKCRRALESYSRLYFKLILQGMYLANTETLYKSMYTSLSSLLGNKTSMVQKKKEKVWFPLHSLLRSHHPSIKCGKWGSKSSNAEKLYAFPSPSTVAWNS